MPAHRDTSTREKKPPPQEYHGSTRFEDGFRPRLNNAMSKYAEGQQPEKADSHGLHRGAPVEEDRGTSATSSIHAVPRILLPSFSLRIRRSTTCRSFVSELAVNSTASSAHGCVPNAFGVKRERLPG